MSGSTAVAPSPPLGADGHGRGPGAGRELRRRRPLPTGRAVVGGLLVTLSALGLFVAWSTATAPPTTPFVVAARDLAVGARVGPGDLAAAPAQLPPALARRAFPAGRAGTLAGAVVLAPIGRGELVQASAVLSPTGGAAFPGSTLEVSIPVARSRAVGGTLRPGAFVDVLATFGTGADTYTTTVVGGARVVATGGDAAGAVGRGIGDLGEGTVTLAVATAEDARAVVHAATAGEVTLVRSAAPAAERLGTYRAPAGGRGE